MKAHLDPDCRIDIGRVRGLFSADSSHTDADSDAKHRNQLARYATFRHRANKIHLEEVALERD